VLPFLLDTGLLNFKGHYKELSKGYYYIETVVLLLAFMYLCRIKNPEQLAQISPGEFGKLLGLDRSPGAKCLRKKLKEICAQQKSTEWNMGLAREWSQEEGNDFYYIDGHVQVYHGHKATLGKKHVSRQKLCLPGIQEFWVNNGQGQPYFYVTGQVNEKLQEVISGQIVPELLDKLNNEQQTLDTPRFTIVFDREAYSPQFFGQLWQDHQIAVLTYRKNVKDQWEESCFKKYTINVESTEVEMALAEKQLILDGVEMREVRKLSKDGHQTSVITTHPLLSTALIALYMFARWSQENFFRYMRQDYDFDKIGQYTVDQIDDMFEVVNPAHNKVEYKIRKIREKIARRKARIYTLIEAYSGQDIDQTPSYLAKVEKQQQELKALLNEEQDLIEQRKNTQHRIKIKDMGENRYNKLDMESKLFRNIIKMICYRAETSFATLLSANYKKAINEKRALAKKVINASADLTVDMEKQTLQVSLYSLPNPRDNQALSEICQTLNEMEIIFPGTKLQMIYDIATK